MLYCSRGTWPPAPSWDEGDRGIGRILPEWRIGSKVLGERDSALALVVVLMFLAVPGWRCESSKKITLARVFRASTRLVPRRERPIDRANIRRWLAKSQM